MIETFALSKAKLDPDHPTTLTTMSRLAGAYVEAPAVPCALDCVAAEVAVGERRALVRAEVFDGVELAADVVEREFLPVQKFHGRAAPFGQVFDAPDRDELILARGPLRVDESTTERLHGRPAS